MYTLTDEQIASVKTFIGKIPDSLIKSRCEKWLAEVEPTKRATSEQMEQFVAFATHLPVELQNFPQSFAHAVKNAPETIKREAEQKTVQGANLTALATASIASVPNVSAPDNKEETLHKLGTKGKAAAQPVKKN